MLSSPFVCGYVWFWVWVFMNSRSVVVPRQCSWVFLGFVVIGIFKCAAETLCWQSFAFNVDCRPVVCVVNPDFLSISTSHTWVCFLSKGSLTKENTQAEVVQPGIPASVPNKASGKYVGFWIFLSDVYQQWWHSDGREQAASLLGLVHRQKQASFCHSLQILYFLYFCWCFVMATMFCTSKLCSLNLRKRTLNFLSQFNLNRIN